MNKTMNVPPTNKVGRYLLLAILFIGSCLLPDFAKARPAINLPPAFSAGTNQSISLCKNAAANVLNSSLAIIDSDAGQTENWTVIVAPMHGTLSGLPVSATSTGGLVTPSWITYTPATGYTGADTFTVQVSDGFATATTTFSITISATPALTSTLTPAAICDQSVFNYTPVTSVPAAVVNWHRVFVPGLSNPTASGTGNPAETLFNITNDDVVSSYLFTLSNGGCGSQSTVTVTVHPTPRLTGSLIDTACSGSTFVYHPVSVTAGATFSWSRATVTGIEPATSSGTGMINEILTNSTATTLTAVYSFLLSANGCTSVRNLVVAVPPKVDTTPITTFSPSVLCSGTLYQNFGASTLPSPGSTYKWTAKNAEVWATGNTGQYCVVSFPNAGDANVSLTVSGNSSKCASGSEYKVTVGNAYSDASTIIYYNNQFLYQDNTQDTYQWGYDDATTLDSTLISGATFQGYLNTSPDFGNKYYWVMTTKGSCSQKVYFNAPVSVASLTSGEKTSPIQLLPNPASNRVQLDINVPTSASVTTFVTDITGRLIFKQSNIGNKFELNIEQLPEGCYFVSCFDGGLKLGTAKLIKKQE